MIIFKDSESLLSGSFFVRKNLLNEKVKDAPNILKLPEGDYLCFRERILEEAWNPQRIISYFQGKAKPELMLAMEYEDNLDNYAHANYEIQILLEKN